MTSLRGSTHTRRPFATEMGSMPRLRQDGTSPSTLESGVNGYIFVEIDTIDIQKYHDIQEHS